MHSCECMSQNKPLISSQVSILFKLCYFVALLWRIKLQTKPLFKLFTNRQCLFESCKQWLWLEPAHLGKVIERVLLNSSFRCLREHQKGSLCMIPDSLAKAVELVWSSLPSRWAIHLPARKDCYQLSLHRLQQPHFLQTSFSFIDFSRGCWQEKWHARVNTILNWQNYKPFNLF